MQMSHVGRYAVSLQKNMKPKTKKPTPTKPRPVTPSHPYSKFPSGSYKASIRIPHDLKIRDEVMGRFYKILEEYEQ